MISQLGIVVFGVTAIWLSQDPRPRVARWACIVGLVGQPFWFTAVQPGQWGIFAVSVLYTVSWLRGLYGYWIKPRREQIEKE